jgi:hypothetical protein
MPNRQKVKRSYTAGVTPTAAELGSHEFAVNWADGIVFVKAADGSVQSVTLGGGGGGSSGGGSANIVEASTAAGFPAVGSVGTLYHATDARRIYFWDVSGVYVEAGTSGGTGEDATLRALFVPAAPTSVTATGGNAQATVSWTAPAALSILPITDYTVQFSSNSGSSWASFTRAASTATSATVTGLTNGTAYVFRVAAVNALGTGAYSTASSAVTPVAASASLAVTTAGSGSGSWSGAGTQASPFVRSAVGWSGSGNWVADPVFTASGSGSVRISWASRTQAGDADPALYVQKNNTTVQTLAWSSSGASITPVSVVAGDTVRLVTENVGQQLTTVSAWIQ